MPVVQLALHAKSSTLYGWSYSRTSKFFQLDGLLLFCVIIRPHSASSAIIIITSFRIYNQLILRKENVTQPLGKEVLRFYLKVASNLLFPISSRREFHPPYVLKITIELLNLTMSQSYNQWQKKLCIKLIFQSKNLPSSPSTILHQHSKFW